MKFKISTGLKNLIGRELITDAYVAIFELVKNSYDANASQVTLSFHPGDSSNESCIVIADDGCGMDEDDIRDKWLFVGYSVKSTTNITNNYRNQIKSKRPFAGAKGVGRFSCDRLGAQLELFSRKKGKTRIENLVINWDDFERNSEDEFIDVEVTYRSLSESKYLKGESGTVLIIRGVRDSWARKELLTLKNHLTKLINPISVSEDNFSIYINSQKEKEADSKINNRHLRVNGPVKNFIFENLRLKTTSIDVEISDDGEEIKTTLLDRGRLIYWIREKNTYSSLPGCKIKLFQLNRIAKQNFTKLMQVAPINFGSVFVYKNGFRIYPYGEPKDDSLGIDKRKQQGYNRFLGTRDLIGRIELWGECPGLTETTSRAGGFIKTAEFEELASLFIDFALKRLEKYAVDVIKWGDDKLDKATGSSKPIEPDDVRTEILEIILRLTKSRDYIDVGYDDKFLKIYEDAQSKSALGEARELIHVVKLSKNPEYISKVQEHVKKVSGLITAKEELEKENDRKEKQLAKTEALLEIKSSQNLFLQSIENQDMQRILAFHHDICVYADAIKSWISYILPKVKQGGVCNDDITEFIEGVSMSNDKILSVARFATKANFSHAGKKMTSDIVKYIQQYVKEVVSVYVRDIEFSIEGAVDYNVTFIPLEINALIDNITSNSQKFGAKKLCIAFEKQGNRLKISLADDGKGLSANIKNIDDIFQKGFTTTQGSGIGLYSVSQIVCEKLHGKIFVDESYVGGMKLTIII